MSLPSNLILTEEYSKSMHHENDARMAHKIALKFPKLLSIRSNSVDFKLHKVTNWEQVSIKSYQTREVLFDNPSQ